MQRTFMMTLSMIIASSLVGLITGLTIPMISLNMSNKGFPAFIVGLLAALPAAGMLISSFMTPWLSVRAKFKNVIFGALFLLLAGTIGSCIIANVYILSIVRLITGIASGILVILGESWITGNSSLRYRAVITGIYTSTFTGFQLIGPLLISIGNDFLPHILLSITALTLAAFFLAYQSKAELKIDTGHKTSWQSLFWLLPALSSGVFCFSFFDASILSFFSLYSLDKGVTAELSLLLISIILIGDAAFQVPIGYLADKFGARKMHLILGFLFCLILVFLPELFNSRLFLIAGCAALGAVAGGLYTLSLVRAGTLLGGQRLIVMNAILNLVWAAGSISGPVFSGAIITHFGYNSFTNALLIIGIMFFFFQLLPVDSKERRCSQNVSQR